MNACKISTYKRTPKYFIARRPTNCNLYAYGANNPVKYTDPDGRSPTRDDFAYQKRMNGESEIANYIEKQAAEDNPQQFIVPAFCGVAPPVGYSWDDSSQVTSPWSKDRPQYDTTDGRKTLIGHNGMDFDGEIGDRINSITNGEVDIIGFDSGYGKYIVVKNNNGKKLLYGHLSKIDVSKGQTVVAGMKIGEMGNTGKVVAENGGDGSHLHLGYDGDGDGRFRSTTPCDDPARVLYGD